MTHAFREHRAARRGARSAICSLYEYWFFIQLCSILPPPLSTAGVNPVNKVVHAPTPPYYAVIAPAELADDVRGYPELAAKLVELAKEQPGFLGIESGFQRGFALAVSYWDSLEAIERWSKNSSHMIAKEKGKSAWFKTYVTRIARVERVY
jgi:heme-degrading monooxygenase HmoA